MNKHIRQSAIQNVLRSPAFIKIKHAILSSNGSQLDTCLRMIENSEATMSDREQAILREYFIEQKNKYVCNLKSSL